MSEFDYQLYRITNHLDDERLEQVQRTRFPRQRRSRSRHALANRLHHLADRIDL